jgi:hypothetical protein
VFARRHPHVATQPVVHHLPGPVLLPAPKILVDKLPGGEVAGPQAPGAATAQKIQDAIEAFPFGLLLWTAPRLGGRHIGDDQCPFLVSQISRIRFSGFHASHGNPVSSATASLLTTL